MIRVRIPATSANLGPGFDCMGLALDLWNTFELHLAGEPGEVTVETRGEGSDVLPADRTHLVAQTMVDETWPGTMPEDCGLHIVCDNGVPCASGLGSSSTAVLAGLVFASALAARAIHRDHPERVLETVRDEANLRRVLSRAVKLEGHGDNVAPALLGGFIIVVPNGRGPIIEKVPFQPMRVSVCIPRFDFLTSVARAALPGQYSKEDAIFNVGHALLISHALREGDEKLLAESMGDRIHEPYRLPLIPGAAEAKKAALAAGATAACLSGAGPGMIAFAREGHDRIGQAMVQAFANSGLQARSWTIDAIDAGLSVEAA